MSGGGAMVSRSPDPEDRPELAIHLGQHHLVEHPADLGHRPRSGGGQRRPPGS